MKRWKNDTKIFDYVADREFFGTHFIVLMTYCAIIKKETNI